MLSAAAAENRVLSAQGEKLTSDLAAEKQNSADLTDTGHAWLAKEVNDANLFVLPDLAMQMAELDSLPEEERLEKKDQLYTDYAIKSCSDILRYPGRTTLQK